MDTSDETRQLLREIRDAQRQSLEEYRRVTGRSLELQEQAVARQEQLGALYKKALVAGAIVILPLLGLLLYLLTYLW
jgi:predicted transcriptional regulator